MTGSQSSHDEGVILYILRDSGGNDVGFLCDFDGVKPPYSKAGRIIRRATEPDDSGTSNEVPNWYGQDPFDTLQDLLEEKLRENGLPSIGDKAHIEIHAASNLTQLFGDPLKVVDYRIFTREQYERASDKWSEDTQKYNEEVRVISDEYDAQHRRLNETREFLRRKETEEIEGIPKPLTIEDRLKDSE